MNTRIVKPDEADETTTPERCAILELSNDPDDPEVSIARARVAPGVTTAWHKLTGVAERYVILEGEGLVEVGDLAPTKLSPGDVVRIPPGVRQRITNTGEQDLIFHAICTPRFVPECYVDLEGDDSSGV
ncbi:MAG: cupin domain-containing protein [Opitutaceae bacterium]